MGVWVGSLLGAMLALYAFMTDTIGAVGGGEVAVRQVLPTTFNWSLFSVALALMAAPIFGEIRFLRGHSMAHADRPAGEQQTDFA